MTLKKVAMTVTMALATVSMSVLAANDPLTRSLDKLAPSIDNPPWYYEIGGSDYIMLPLYDKTKMRLGANLSWNGNLMCGNINPDISLDAFMNGVKEGWVQLQDRAVATVQGTIASLPGLVLQHIDPGLYEMISTGFIQAEELFQIELADCRRITSDLAEGKPNSDWIKVSGYEKYRDYFMEDSDPADPADDDEPSPPPKSNINEDMGEMVKEADADVGREGVDWVCGDKQGGDGQEPIKSTQIMTASYNKLIDRGNCDMTVPSFGASEEPPLYVDYWSEPSVAESWMKDVLGESEIYTTPDKKPLRKSPGTGLMPKVEEEAKDVYGKIKTLLESPDEPTLAQLREVSFTNALVSVEVIDAIRNDPHAGMFAKRLALDVALQRQLMQALEARRLLYVGAEIEEVAAREPSKELVNNYITRLNAEISMIREEIEIRTMMTSSTAPYLLRRKAKRDMSIMQDSAKSQVEVR